MATAGHNTQQIAHVIIYTFIKSNARRKTYCFLVARCILGSVHKGKGERIKEEKIKRIQNKK
jgi:hypothetical protein